MFRHATVGALALSFLVVSAVPVLAARSVKIVVWLSINGGTYKTIGSATGSGSWPSADLNTLKSAVSKSHQWIDSHPREHWANPVVVQIYRYVNDSGGRIARSDEYYGLWPKPERGALTQANSRAQTFIKKHDAGTSSSVTRAILPGIGEADPMMELESCLSFLAHEAMAFVTEPDLDPAGLEYLEAILEGCVAPAETD